MKIIYKKLVYIKIKLYIYNVIKIKQLIIITCFILNIDPLSWRS